MPDLGRKYTCYSCHTKFYDLGKPEPLCPKCGADQRDADEAPVYTAPRRSRVVEEPADLAAAAGDLAGQPGDHRRARRALLLQHARLAGLLLLVVHQLVAPRARIALEPGELPGPGAQLGDQVGAGALDVSVVGEVARDRRRVLAFERQAQVVDADGARRGLWTLVAWPNSTKTSPVLLFSNGAPRIRSVRPSLLTSPAAIDRIARLLMTIEAAAVVMLTVGLLPSEAPPLNT